MSALLESRASFELAALVVTWLAVTVLLLIVVNLHTRLQRVERRLPGARTERAYGRLLGRSVGEILGGRVAGSPPRLLLFLSSDCPSCDGLLDELSSNGWPGSATLLWTDRTPEELRALPPNVSIVDEGPRIAAELGIRVTPFAMIAGDGERIVDASPVNSLPPVDSINDLDPATPPN